jgi:hypothetical protein
MDDSPYPSLEARIDQLRPTQMAVGYEEVSLKRKEWRERSATAAKRFLHDHRFPAVRGPNKRYYIVDHHHLGRALLEEKVGLAYIAVVHDLSHLDRDEFWIVMEHYQLVHPYDEKGRRRNISDMLRCTGTSARDPLRSASGKQARNRGERVLHRAICRREPASSCLRERHLCDASSGSSHQLNLTRECFLQTRGMERRGRSSYCKLHLSSLFPTWHSGVESAKSWPNSEPAA